MKAIPTRPGGHLANVPIKVFLIAQSQINRGELRKWVRHIGAKKFALPDKKVVSGPSAIVGVGAKRCYNSFEVGLNPNITKVRDDWSDYLLNVLKQGHGSVLEHASFTLAIEGVSRVFTGEMNRHRAGWAISEGSMRFIRFDKKIPWWLPTSLQPNAGDNPELARKKKETVKIFRKAFKHQEDCYAEMLAVWEMDESDKNFHYKKVVTSCLRRIVGMGVATGGIWTGNARALRHVITMRTEPGAEEEIAYVFSRVAEIMTAREPLLFPDFVKNEAGTWIPRFRKV